MGLYDRDYVHEKKAAHNTNVSGARTGGTSKPGAKARPARPAQPSRSTTETPPTPAKRGQIYFLRKTASPDPEAP